MTETEVKSLWKAFKKEGIDDPLTIVDQITLILFITLFGRFFDCPYEVFRNMDSSSQFELFRPALFSKLRQIGIRQGLPPDCFEDIVFKIPSRDAWKAIFEQYRKIDWTQQETGELAFETLLTLLARDGRSSVFLTPRHISKMMVDLAEVSCNDSFWDPACGTGDMLVEAAKKADGCSAGCRLWGEKLLGSDTNRCLLRIAAMNLIVHQVGSFELSGEDSLSRRLPVSPTAIVSHFPFGGHAQVKRTDSYLAYLTEKVELLFLERLVSSLRPEGRCVCLVPEGVLFGASKAHQELKRWMVEQSSVLGVIRLPKGVLLPYSSISVSLMILIKKKHSQRDSINSLDSVWFYDLESDGFSLNKKRIPVEKNDVPEAIARFLDWRHRGVASREAHRSRKEKSFVVSMDEIARNNFSLSLSGYRESSVEEKLDFPPADTLQRDLRLIEADLRRSLLDLESILNS